MRNLLVFSLLMVAAFTMTRCNKDDGTNNAIYNALGTVKISDDSTIVILDNNQRMLVKNVNELTTVPKNGTRIIAYFNIVSETDPNIDLVVNLLSWEQLLFKPVVKLTSTNSDSLGKDPINISKVWIAHNYLNVSFSFYAYNNTHTFDLARVMSDTRTDTITLEIRHNADKDDLSNLYNGVMTFDLSSLKSTAADSVVLDIRAKQYESRTYQGFFTYKY
jgi:hypothetical protein